MPIERYISYFTHYLPLPPPGTLHDRRAPPRLTCVYYSDLLASHTPPPPPLFSAGVHALHLRLDLGLHDPIVDLPTSLEPIIFRLPGTTHRPC